MSSTMRVGTLDQLAQNWSISAACSRMSVRHDTRFSSRDMVGCEHKSSPVSGPRPTASLKIGSLRNASQSSASS